MYADPEKDQPNFSQPHKLLSRPLRIRRRCQGRSINAMLFEKRHPAWGSAGAACRNGTVSPATFQACLSVVSVFHNAVSGRTAHPCRPWWKQSWFRLMTDPANRICAAPSPCGDGERSVADREARPDLIFMNQSSARASPPNSRSPWRPPRDHRLCAEIRRPRRHRVPPFSAPADRRHRRSG